MIIRYCLPTINIDKKKKLLSDCLMSSKKKIFNDIKDDILVSFILLTAFPLLKYRKNTEKPNYTRAQWAFPIIGIFVGIITLLIIKFFIFIGLNLIISSTFGVLSNIYVLGFLDNRHERGSVEKQINSDLMVQNINSKNYLFLVFSVFLKINLLAELLKVEGFIYIIIGCYSLGIFSIVLLRTISYSFIDDDFSKIIGKSSNKNLLLSTFIVFCTIIPLGLMISIILLITVYAIAFFTNTFLKNFHNKKKLRPLGIYTQIVEINSLLIFYIWFV